MEERGDLAAALVFETRELSVSYGPIHALHSFDMRMAAGEAVCVLGTNGAGKTTLLRTISGLLRGYAGSVIFQGDHIEREPAWAITRMGVAHVPQGRRCFPGMSVEDNLLMGVHPKCVRPAADGLDEVFDVFPVLAEKRRQDADELSGGQQQMVAIGRALMSEPRLLLLDEPSLGLAPRLVEDVAEVLQRLRDQTGTSIILVEQHIPLATAVATRGYILQQGRCVVAGPSRELVVRAEEVFLGGMRTE